MDALFSGYEETISLQNLDPSVYVHPTAIVAKGAELAKGVRVGPFAQIGAHVRLAENVKIGAHAVIEGRVSVGCATTIFPYASIGSVPQDLKYQGEDTTVEIGERNRIREYVNISLGTDGGGGKTIIGHDNLIMVYTHIGHDCIVGNHCIFANAVQLAGHVTVGDSVVFGGLSGAHQFSKYGNLAMIAAGAMCSQDVPPFCMVHGDHARINGLNVVGLRRSSIKNLSDIKSMYRIVYGENLSLDDAIKKISDEVAPSPEKTVFLSFLKSSQRGICR